jgi:hypothetical protein
VDAAKHAARVVRLMDGDPATFTGLVEEAAACRKAGVLHVGKPPVGAIPMWRGGKHGHVAVQGSRDYILTVDLPRSNRIGRVKRDVVRSQWGYRYVGWVNATDVPGWR